MAEERTIVAWLTVGRNRALVSHQSALAALGLAAPSDEIHVTVKPGAAVPSMLPPGIVVHVGDTSERTGAGCLVVTRAQRSLEDCAAAGAPPAYVAEARRRAIRKKLLGPSPAPQRQTPLDPALHLALLEHLLPMSLLFAQVDEQPPAELRAWALAQPLPDEDEPLDELRWNASAGLRLACQADDEATVRSIDGLEHYTALRALVLRPSLLTSIAPLAELMELELLEIGVTPTTDLAPLRACRALRRIRLLGAGAPAHVDDLDALARAGVVIDGVGDRRPPDLRPFVDRNLKLAVLDELVRLGAIALPDLIPIDEYELDEDNLDRLLAISLTSTDLARIEELSWEGGGRPIQHLVWPQFDGESDEFALRDLTGIEALPNLKRVEVDFKQVFPVSET
jgi:hypothetical protein